MAFLSGFADTVGAAVKDSRSSLRVILSIAFVSALVALFFPHPTVRGVGLSIGGTLCALASGIMYSAGRTVRQGQRDLQAIETLLAQDRTASLVTGPGGFLAYINTSAKRLLEIDEARSLTAALKHLCPHPTPMLLRLESRRVARRAAREDFVTHQGHVRINVHPVGEAYMLWRIEKSADLPARADAGPVFPTITLGRRNTILFMNTPARDLIGGRAQTLKEVCDAGQLRPGALNRIITRKGAVTCLVIEAEGVAGRRELFLIPAQNVEGGSEGLSPAQPESDLESLPVPVLKLTGSGEVIGSNAKARALLSFEMDEALRASDLVDGLGRSVTDWIADAAAGRGSIRPEMLSIRRGADGMVAQVTLGAVREGGEPLIYAVLQDATKLKSLEEQFVQSQKMQAIGQLAGGVAHDFNNLLTAISGHCDLLLLRHDQEDGDYADLMQIHQNTNRAAALVGQLLAYSRKQTLRPQVISLRDGLADLGHLLNRLVGERVTVALSHDPDLAMVRADKRQIEQVLVNLVINARDAMPHGGEITIATETRTLDNPLSRDGAVVAPGRYVAITVRDQGEGIAPDKIDKVFEPFFTTKKQGEGTGLGLSTAYGIVKQTGGFIFVDSTPGEGSCFEVLLPAHETEAGTDRETAAEPPDLPAAKGTVLLVEDEAPVRAFASRALQIAGFSVLEAGSGEEALELLEDATLCVDVFVTDVVMPGRDGPSWVQEAIATRPDARVVFMSGYAEESFADAKALIPKSIFLSKPFALTELTDTVRGQLA